MCGPSLFILYIKQCETGSGTCHCFLTSLAGRVVRSICTSGDSYRRVIWVGPLPSFVASICFIHQILPCSVKLSYFLAQSWIEHRAQPPSCYGALVKREEGDSKEEVPGSNPCGRGGDKDALCRWEPMGGSFLNARGRTTSVDLSLFY